MRNEAKEAPTQEGPRCPRCDGVLRHEGEHCSACESTVAISGSSADPPAVRVIDDRPRFVPGARLGDRYVVVGELGTGGMGEVYRVLDRELERQVALKVLQRSVAVDAGAADRFKREVQLATQITHPNVLRVYDLGEADGVKFLTMHLVQGEDLGDRIVRGKRLAPAEIARIGREIALGLAAAHDQGVVHRDLKPSNVLLDENGHVYVADFGLAVSVAHAGAIAAELSGTPAYMAPEQVTGGRVDARADVFALGVMLYQMATGQLPFRGASSAELMNARLSQRARPVRELAPELPEAMATLVDGCLAKDPEQRASARRVAEALAPFDPRRSAPPPARQKRRLPRRAWPWAALAGVLALGGAAVWAGAQRGASEPASTSAASSASAAPPPLHGTPAAPLKVLVADAVNATGDAALDETIEVPLETVLSDAPVVSIAWNSRARPLVRKGASWREVAERQHVSLLVEPRLLVVNGHLRATARLVDVSGARLPRELGRDAADTADMPRALSLLALDVGAALGDDASPERRQHDVGVFAPAPLEAVRALKAAHERFEAADWIGTMEEARRAIAADPGFGEAHAALALALANSERGGEAATEYEVALTHADRLTQRSLLNVRGRALSLRGDLHAIDVYRDFVQAFPGDYAGANNLSAAYASLWDVPHALEWAHRAVELEPTRPIARMNLAMDALYAGDAAAAESEIANALSLSPSCEGCRFRLGIIALAAGRTDDARRAYDEARAAGGTDTAQGMLGAADLALYEGRADDALGVLAAPPSDQGPRLREYVAMAYALRAEAQVAAGHTREARADLARATALAKGHDALFVAARTLAALGDAAMATTIANDLAARVEPLPRALAGVVLAEVALARKQPREAIARLEEARRTLDVWLLHATLGRAYEEMGAHLQAQAELETCAKRRGEAFSALIGWPTARFWPPVVYWRARAEEGLGMPTATASYRELLAMRGGAASDALLADARARLAARAP